MNNEEKFKSLSTDVLAEVLSQLAYEGFCNNWYSFDVDRECDMNCKECVKEWLKQEVDEDEWSENLE